mgnify:CR=1 FL=1
MTDLEMTKLCAEAMGLEIFWAEALPITAPKGCPYDPLHDDAQAMALVKKFHIALGWNDPGWGAFGQHDKRWVNNPDLNRAIVECVAKMQAAKIKIPA